MSRDVTLAGYALLAVAAASMELGARSRGGIATVSATLSSALRNRAVRVVIVAGWLWLGWHVFVRVSWR